MSEETRETTRLPRGVFRNTTEAVTEENAEELERRFLEAQATGQPTVISPSEGWRFEPRRAAQTRSRAVEPRRAKGMWVPTWLFWLWWVLVLVPSALLVYESVVGW